MALMESLVPFKLVESIPLSRPVYHSMSAADNVFALAIPAPGFPEYAVPP